MNKPRTYHTLRARWETAEGYREHGKTSEASDLTQLTIAEALIEILATLEEISDTLKGSETEKPPAKISAAAKKG